ncbi:MAG: hypothetical protein AB7O57_19465 [Hyphomicrobiaceae bacterium]
MTNNMDGAAAAREKWHLKKEVPLAIIIALIVQAAGLVYWGGSLDRNDEVQDRRIAILETMILNSDLSAAPRRLDELERREQQRDERDRLISERLTRIEEGLSFTTEILKDMKASLASQAAQRLR